MSDAAHDTVSTYLEALENLYTKAELSMDVIDIVQAVVAYENKDDNPELAESVYSTPNSIFIAAQAKATRSLQPGDEIIDEGCCGVEDKIDNDESRWVHVYAVIAVDRSDVDEVYHPDLDPERMEQKILEVCFKIAPEIFQNYEYKLHLTYTTPTAIAPK